VKYNLKQSKTQDADLVDSDVVHNEVEPEAEPWVARVRSDEQVIFVLRDQVHTSKVTCTESETSNPIVLCCVSDPQIECNFTGPINTYIVRHLVTLHEGAIID
jgi:hypothetical protein